MNLIVLQVERHERDHEKEKRHNELKSELAWLDTLTPIELQHLGKQPRFQYLIRELSRTAPRQQRP